eukprot:TRINITY_DN6944_c0_g1_i1.p1 TRINITY_DN6944_c0_g1~~TRINITY_DN6944_c0_g1_i1.p1  ORF type:complete len:445 (+),score=107.55 TRINITY_DN6944_c0_g1_i1:23-1336(+)
MSASSSSSPEYQSGFGNEFLSEALPDTVPKNQNSPQQCPRGLYAEQLSGTAFTVPRANNQRSWLYRIRPSVCHTPFVAYNKNPRFSSDFSSPSTPNQLRWKPMSIPEEPTDFVDGLFTVAGAGAPATRGGLAIYNYLANKDMVNRSFYSSDGDMLIVPQQGRLHVRTEFGLLHVAPGEIVVIPRGINFAVALPDGPSRGYVCEVFDGNFQLPDLGPIGANGLANPRDFLYPVASFIDDDVVEKFERVNKFQGKMYTAESDHSVFNVVGWHGNYLPFKYDLDRFCAMNTVSYDHPDPCIFTVLTVKTNTPGVAALDFVCFPPRWAVGENTFRPPYFHRNIMTEYMGLIKGEYEAKKGAFCPGGGSLHSAMTPHGPDTNTFNGASNAELKPVRVADGTMAFMFETSYMLSVTEEGGTSALLDNDYYKCWEGLKSNFVKE